MLLNACLKEWLLPFGTGGYASSTFCGINARTYHGLLVAPLNPPHKRFVLLSKFEESLIVDSREIPFSSNIYVPNVVHPKGHQYLLSYEWGLNYVKWEYDVEGIKVIKELVACDGIDCISVKYKADEGKLRVCPLVAYRSHHDVMKVGEHYFTYSVDSRNVIVHVDGRPFLRFYFLTPFRPSLTGYWYYNFQYDFDREMGNHYVEDLYNPFCVEAEKELELLALVDKASYPEERKPPVGEVNILKEAGKKFVVKGREGYAIIAGYHWFDEWGRDSFISMEGLLLMNGWFKQAQDIFRRYFNYANRGLLPNHIGPNGDPHYLGVDVTLWAINALYKYFLYSNDKEFLKEILPKAEEALWNYVKGNGIVYWKSGLIFHYGAPRTWMDASFDSHVVTPREGSAVEINALMYNALKVINALREVLGLEKEKEFEEVAERLRGSFKENFVTSWGLYDYLDEDMIPDLSIRPNMVFAYSLPFPIGPEEIVDIVKVTVQNELLRPYGLSTLSRHDPKYRPVWRGSRQERDLAYHNGLIWPWLIGAYTDFIARYFPAELPRLLQLFSPLLDQIRERNGFLPELFEDVPPYKPAGAFAQAWSVAEVLRALDRMITEI